MNLLAQAQGFQAPNLDLHALAPELVLAGVIAAVLIIDLFVDETRKVVVTQLAGIGLLLALIPVVTLAVDGADRSLFGGAYVVDDFSLVFKALFLLSGYVVLLLSTTYLEEGDYYEGEFSFLTLSALLGMVVMSSSRDLLSIFVALELLSLPAYMLAGWRKSDLRSNEASLKYYLLGVLSAAIMLYGMSLIFGVTGTTLLSEIGRQVGGSVGELPLVTLGILFVIVGFAFKVSAVPFHAWAPDTYEGAPTPVTAFLSVTSKAAGFAALLQLVYVGFFGREEVWGPLFWVFAALTMTVGNLIAVRQTNVIRMLAYSSVAQGGFVLVPFAVAGSNVAASQSALSACLTYLIIYAAMNLGAFACVIVIARKTRSGEVTSFGGLFEYAPGLASVFMIFLVSLAGIPPLAGWFAKFVVVRSVLDAGTPAAVVLGVIVAINTVIGFYYYGNVVREMFMRPVPDGDRRPVRIPASLGAAIGLCALAVVVVGFYPNLVARFGDIARLVQ